MTLHQSGFPSVPRLITTISFRQQGESPTLFEASYSSFPAGRYLLLCSLRSDNYPLIQHCRFARHKDEQSPYTFPNFEFAEPPPGIRVGPWPGWRGIPEMPSAIIRITESVHHETPSATIRVAGSVHHQASSAEIRVHPRMGVYDFWGDEFDTGRLRVRFECSLEGSGNVELVIEDSRLVPLEAEVYSIEDRRAVPVPIESIPVSRSHPKLLFTSAELPSLRSQKLSTHAAQWRKLVDLFGGWNLPPGKTPESKALDGPERLFSEDRVLISAFVWLIESTPDNRARAIRALLDYVELTRDPQFEPLKIDTQSGEVLFTLCLGYDWLRDALSAEQEEIVRKRLWEIAYVCWNYLGNGRTDYAQAHFLGCGMGLLAFSFLFWDEHPRAKEWGGFLCGAFERVVEMLPADGFFPHGINLWIYEHEFLLRWLTLLKQCAGLDYWNNTPYWKKASRFRAAATSPDYLYGLTFGDPQYRVGGDSWCHYLIASQTGSGEAQWIGQSLADLPAGGVDFRHVPPRRRVYEYLFFNPAISPVQPTEPVIYFEDGGQVFVRSKGERDSTLFTMRSGPPVGRSRYGHGELGGYGHSDPANGSFLMSRGESILINGSGPSYRRNTSHHNTLTIDGKGQVGDTTVWVPDFYPAEMIPAATQVQSAGHGCIVHADLTSAYLPHLGVQRCSRSLYVDLPSLIIGVDLVQLAEERTAEWNLHTWGRFEKRGVREGREEILLNSNGEETRIVFFSPSGCAVQTKETEFVPAYPHDGKKDMHLVVSKKGTNVMFVWALVIGSARVPEVDLEKKQITLETGRSLTLHDGRLRG